MLSHKRRVALLRELVKVKGEIDDLYWTFTRTAKGKPPILVRPDLYKRRNEIEEELKGNDKKGCRR